MTPVLELADLIKDYRGLRPLRIRELILEGGEAVALVGLDRAAAEVLVNLLTGAILPDAGTVRVSGRSTSSIGDSAEWLALVDRFGLVTERAVLLEHLTVVQNLALPFDLEIEPPTDANRRRAEAIASEVGLPESAWAEAVARLDAASVARVRLGRALAHNPEVLLIEHVNAGLPRPSARELGAAIRAIAAARGAALLAITADDTFARTVASRVLRHDAATGRLR